jgi:hypothetical protein
MPIPDSKLWSNHQARFMADLLKTPYKPLPSILDLIDRAERWPLYVYYDHSGVRYVPRDHFYMGPRIDRPSDCVWIVPGSTP